MGIAEIILKTNQLLQPVLYVMGNWLQTMYAHTFLLPYIAGISTASPYSYQLHSAANYSAQQHPASLSPMQPTSQRIPHGVGSSLIYSESSPQVSSTPGLYGRPPLPPTMMAAMPTFNWPAMPTPPLLPSTSVSVQSRPCGSNAAPMHSPITAQVYSADLRTHSGQLLEVNDGTYTPPQQHSPPEHMLPECASSEPSKCFLENSMFRNLFLTAAIWMCVMEEKNWCLLFGYIWNLPHLRKW